MKSRAVKVVSRTRSRTKGWWRSRRGRTVGKPSVLIAWCSQAQGLQPLGLLTVDGVRRRHAGARRHADSLREQALLQRPQEEQHVVRPAAVPHQADAPGLALERA